MIAKDKRHRWRESFAIMRRARAIMLRASGIIAAATAARLTARHGNARMLGR
jgi:hypothetical protein